MASAELQTGPSLAVASHVIISQNASELGQSWTAFPTMLWGFSPPFSQTDARSRRRPAISLNQSQRAGGGQVRWAGLRVTTGSGSQKKKKQRFRILPGGGCWSERRRGLVR